MPANPNVMNIATSIIRAHIQSPLVKGTQKLKKNTVQEKPTGASLTAPFLLLSLIVAKAIRDILTVSCVCQDF